ncbi:MAG TPA: Cys-Gln thioester bond-forming surface protein [Streptomyces sp.]|uniref:Cys-Gln thioester bond-forming surface protein n=1 Tax=Streptomyces sp. TaxID=1931 RepID=UPI002C9941E2|nr:Cys-Gln thioester bond-forming surface protein [Streptomyces sp.]HWU08681.1 Cys-Gln thioester bond-forming surface protein [Streptomyces sp.]
MPFRGRADGLVRVASTALVTGLVAAGALAGVGTAAADEAPAHQGSGTSAVLDGLKTYDTAVITTPGENGGEARTKRVSAGLFEMTVDGGGTLETYCIDIHNPTQDKAKYLETPWAQSSLGKNDDAGKIRWILEHSYPQIDDLTSLAKKAGTGPLTERTAAAGTQVAIWRYSDGADVTAANEDAEKLADYLQGAARSSSEPPASLTLTPATVSGQAGGLLGPVTVHTDATEASVTPPAGAAADGVRITDKDGNAVTRAANGTELYFDVPKDSADGSASFSVQATTTVPVGRVFAGVTKSQTQILAGSTESAFSAQATASWAAKGPAPAVTAQKNCAKGSVDFTVTNNGDQPFRFTFAAGTDHTVEAGGTKTVSLPVAEDAAYDITLSGVDTEFTQNFKGVLDCVTTPAPAPGDDEGVETQDGASPSPAATAAADVTGGGEGDLAATGGSSATPVIAGVAAVLVVLGGAAVFFLRRKKTAAGTR